MHLTVFAELSLIIALGAAIALVMRIIKQPLIIGHIITGIALLLFIIGLGLNPRVIKEVGKVASLVGILQVAFTTGVGWLGGQILGFGSLESLFFGLALAFSSTIIILKLLTDKKEQNRLYGKIVTGLLLVQDIIAATALFFVTAKGSGGFSPLKLAELGGKGLLIVIPLFVVGTIVLPRLHKLIAGSQEFLFLFAIGWGFGAAALFERAGFSLEIGALLAGVALAGLPYAQEISARLRPLRDFFIIVFFIKLGTGLNFGNLSLLLPSIIIGSFVVIVLKPLIVLGIAGSMGYTKRTSFKAAIATAQVSEFSLVFVILGNKQGLVSNDLVAIITLIALITIAVSSYMIIYADKLYPLFERELGMFERRKVLHKDIERRRSYDMVLFGYHKGGQEFIKVFQSLKKSFVVVDYDPEVIDTLEHQKIEYLYGDSSDIELLEEIGLEKSRLVVSTITNYQLNLFLLKLTLQKNSSAVVICHADNVQEAEELYDHGASYVMMPHYIGSEKIGAFIRRSGLKRSEFRIYREKHLAYLRRNYEFAEDEFKDSGTEV
jgi:Kef-type K+ transport system membrane component KefB